MFNGFGMKQADQIIQNWKISISFIDA